MKLILLSFLLMAVNSSVASAMSSASVESPCDLLLAKAQDPETWSKISVAELEMQLNSAGYSILDLGLQINRSQLLEIFNSHPFFGLPTAQSRSREIEYRKSADWAVDSMYENELEKTLLEFPDIYKQIGMQIGFKMERPYCNWHCQVKT